MSIAPRSSMTPTSPTYHRDHTVTLWDVYQQGWIRTATPPARVVASLDPSVRERVTRHCRLPGMPVRLLTPSVGQGFGCCASLRTLTGEIVWSGPTRPFGQTTVAREDGTAKAAAMLWVVV